MPTWVLGGFLIAALAAAGAALRAFRTLGRRERMFRALAEGASDGLVLMEPDSRIVWANPAYFRIMRRPQDQIIGAYPLRFALPPGLTPPEEEVRAFRFDPREERFGRLTQYRNIRGDGTEFIHEFSHAAIPWGSHDFRVLLIGRDISDRIAREQALLAAQKRLVRQAQTDALTGLANRQRFRDLLVAQETRKTAFAIFHIDINGFKEINGSFGQQAGDALLRHLAEALRAQASGDWTLARTGGDEFAVIARDLTSLEAASDAAERLARRVRAPMIWKAGSLRTTVSVGVAVWDPSVPTPDALLHRAEVALREAKSRHGVWIAAYDPPMHRRHVRELTLQKEAASALEDGAIDFHLQPVVDIAARRVVAFEMLARWYRPGGEVLAPGAFLPTIEYLGLSSVLDRNLLESARCTLAELDRNDLGGVSLNLNLSAGAFGGDTVPEDLIWRAGAGQLDAGRIVLELLETTALPDAEVVQTNRQIERLRGVGFRIYLDDFGMGYAGLAHLAALDVQGLKIDRKLTSALGSDETSHCIVVALTELAAQLGLAVVAEGVETAEQIAILQDLGCGTLQGYAIAQPMPRDDAIAWARDWSASGDREQQTG